MAKDKLRLDQLLVEHGYFSTREKAKRSVMAGQIFVDSHKVDKPGKKVSVESQLAVKNDQVKYVSRGGFKLEKALGYFDISVNNRVVIDIGASTGGFTDCLLKNGASHVHAVDVGYGQLAWKLRSDKRVTVFEKTNIRFVSSNLFLPKPDLATIDVSFISLELVIPKIMEVTTYPHEAIILIKPQFEAAKEQVGKKGVVRELSVHINVLQRILLDIIVKLELSVNGLTYSPVTGPQGNIEYLVHVSKYNPSSKTSQLVNSTINHVVNEAYEHFKGGYI